MLEKFKNRNVFICLADYAATMQKWPRESKDYIRKGTVTAIDDNFIELDNDELIAIKYIATIKSL